MLLPERGRKIFVCPFPSFFFSLQNLRQMEEAIGGNPAIRSVPMTKESSDVLSSQVDGAGTSTQVPPASVGGITLSPEQFERLCGEVKSLFNEALPQSPIDCAPPLSGTKESGEEKKEHPEGATGSQKQEKVDLQTAMLSSGLGKEELIAMVQKLSSATLAEIQVPPGDPTSRSSFNPSW